MPDVEISEEGRRTRFERWEQLGLDQVKHDLLNGGYRVVGGPPQVRSLAWEWVRMKEAEQNATFSPARDAARALGLAASTTAEALGISPSPQAVNAETLRALGLQPSTAEIASGPTIDVYKIIKESSASLAQAYKAASGSSVSVGTTSTTKPPERRELITLKPSFMGFSVDLKELSRRCVPTLKRWLGK